MRPVPVLLPLAFLAACASTDKPHHHADEGVTYEARVKTILDQRCAGCHREGGIGTFSLTSYDAAAPLAEAIASSVESGSMPPWLAEEGCNDYQGDPNLAAEEIEALRVWADNDAPQGEVGTSTSTPAQPEPGLSRVDFELRMSEPYLPSAEADDDYRCFLLDWPEEDGFLTGFEVIPGNEALVHHVIAFHVAPEYVDAYLALDEEDEGPGYACFGGPGGDADDLAASAMLGGWAPGGSRGDFPEGTGLFVPEGSMVAMQVHYNLAGADTEPDQSSMLVRFDSEVDQPAGVLPWANPLWIDTEMMRIPADSTGTTHGFSFGLPSELEIWSANLHMHTKGRTGRLAVQHADGSESCLLDIADWDFDWQQSYGLAERVTVQPGDSISIDCSWDNPTPSDIFWGDGTNDEMCVGFMYVTGEGVMGPE